MKKILLLVFILSGLTISNIAQAEQKIAVIDVKAVVSASAQVKELKKDQQNKMKDLEKWLKNAQADVEKQKTTEVKEKLIKKYASDYNKKKADIEKNYQTKLQAIDKSIGETVANTAKAHGYNMVIAKGVVVYGGDDITQEIIKAVK